MKFIRVIDQNNKAYLINTNAIQLISETPLGSNIEFLNRKDIHTKETLVHLYNKIEKINNPYNA